MQRNYRFFFMFVFSTTLLCIYVFAFCWVYIRRIMESEQTNIWKAMIKTPASIVLVIYTFISMWFVGGLTAFHLYLISTNQVGLLFLTLTLCFKYKLSLHTLFQLCTSMLCSCRLHMRTLDIDMIGGATLFTREC